MDKKNVKVCHLTSGHKRYDLRIHQKELASLAKEGYDCYCVVNDEDADCVRDDIKVVSTGFTPHSRYERMILSTKMIYKKALELDADVYHFHDPELLSCGYKLKKKGKIVIFDSHEDVINVIEDRQWIPKPIRKLVKFAYSRFQGYICRRLDAVVVVTPNVAEFFKKINPNTFMVTNFPILEDVAKSETKRRQVCFAGGISEQWSHEIIAQAVSELPDVKYVIAGRGSEGYIEKLKSYPSVEYLGLLNKEQVRTLYAESMVGIAINRAKQTDISGGSLGNTKIFEYMMHALPVICTDYKLYQQIIEDNGCGFCVNRDSVEAIKSAILSLVDDVDRIIECGKRGRVLVEQEYNWAHEEKELFRMYELLLER